MKNKLKSSSGFGCFFNAIRSLIFSCPLLESLALSYFDSLAIHSCFEQSSSCNFIMFFNGVPYPEMLVMHIYFIKIIQSYGVRLTIFWYICSSGYQAPNMGMNQVVGPINLNDTRQHSLLIEVHAARMVCSHHGTRTNPSSTEREMWKVEAKSSWSRNSQISLLDYDIL
uniref:Uncharacterized protein n=1 Tax=Salix viminalis TaxID=40686 RepID=A0A6N2NIR4_SALVM